MPTPTPLRGMSWHAELRMVSMVSPAIASRMATALLEAKKAGKLRFTGFTGHKDPRIHRHMLETARANGFPCDHLQAHDRRRAPGAPGADRALRGGRQVGEVQDHPDVRRHRAAQGVAHVRAALMARAPGCASVRCAGASARRRSR